MDKRQFSELIKPLFYAFGKVQPETIGVYYRYLKDMDPGVLEKAFDTCIRECKRFPPLAEILDAIHRGAIPNEADVWDSIQSWFVHSTPIKDKLTRIVYRDIPNLGRLSPDEARKQVHYSYRYHSEQMIQSLKQGQDYLPGKKTDKLVNKVWNGLIHYKNYED